jgi:FixJ family two-component response regulator
MNETTKAGKPPLVSIIDDDAPFATSVRRVIASVSLKAEAYVSAQTFLDSGKIEETACLVVDIRMPGIDGLELQRRLQETHQDRPIVFLTAHASPDERRRAMASGAVRILSKPVRASDLISAVEEAISRAHGSATKHRVRESTPPAMASKGAASVPVATA